MATVLSVVNASTSGPRRLTAWLEDRAIAVHQIDATTDPLPDTLAGYDGLIMLGGGLMPDDDGAAPWLTTERKLAAEAIAADLPTLGICLGGQLLAYVAGGEVKAKTGPTERGSTLIKPTDAGRTDALFVGFGKGAPMIENHQDLITKLPPAAVLLASSDAVANQAFRLGQNVYGVQFHPEVGAADLTNWNEAALRGAGYCLPDLIAEAERTDAANTTASRAMINAYADVVA